MGYATEDDMTFETIELTNMERAMNCYKLMTTDQIKGAALWASTGKKGHWKQRMIAAVLVLDRRMPTSEFVEFCEVLIKE